MMDFNLSDPVLGENGASSTDEEKHAVGCEINEMKGDEDDDSGSETNDYMLMWMIASLAMHACHHWMK